jgi:hypothetical protein
VISEPVGITIVIGLNSPAPAAVELVALVVFALCASTSEGFMPKNNIISTMSVIKLGALKYHEPYGLNVTLETHNIASDITRKEIDILLNL